MSLTPDELIDRRQLRRKLSFWRLSSFVALGLLLIAIIVYGARDVILSAAQGSHIARIEITGVITNDRPMLRLLKEVSEKDKVKAVILSISSPGGSTVGGETMFEAVRKLADEKPVVAQVGTLATSAGYMIASGTDHIVAHHSSIVGSIGVLFQYADASKLLDNIGVKVNSVKSAPLKAEPNPFNPASEEAVAMISRVIDSSYEWFVDLVAERRNMDRGKVISLADGSIFTGEQGLANGLVDTIGGEAAAIKWLETERGIAEEIEVVDYSPSRPENSLFASSSSIAMLARLLSIDLNSEDISRLNKAIRERLLLDGLVSIWQASE